jgi:two-component system, NtrC family, sensor kinase
MKLTIKLVLYLMLGIILIEMIDGYFSIKREVKLFENHVQQETKLLGHGMEGMITEVWKSSGQQRVLELIREADEREPQVGIRWVWLDVTDGDPFSPEIDRSRLIRIGQDQNIAFKIKEKDGGEFTYTYFPITVAKNRMGALELKKSLADVQNYTKDTIYQITLLMLISFVMAVLLSWILGYRFVGRPLDILTKAIKQISGEEFPEPIIIKKRNELTNLALAFNDMRKNLKRAREEIESESEARIEALNQLRHADRLKTVGSIAAGIAHELGTPLNIISGRSSLITSQKLSDMEKDESANIISTQVKRMSTIINQFLAYARYQKTQKNKIDIRLLVFQTVDLLYPSVNKQTTSIELLGKDIPVFIKIDAGQIQQVLANILTNAINAMADGGKITIDIQEKRTRNNKNFGGKEKDYVCIAVQDEGSGISKEDIDFVFDPFFTTKITGQGTGLGLSIAADICYEHDGYIDVKSEVGKGSCFMVYLPIEPSRSTS